MMFMLFFVMKKTQQSITKSNISDNFCLSFPISDWVSELTEWVRHRKVPDDNVGLKTFEVLTLRKKKQKKHSVVTLDIVFHFTPTIFFKTKPGIHKVREAMLFKNKEQFTSG